MWRITSLGNTHWFCYILHFCIKLNPVEQKHDRIFDAVTTIRSYFRRRGVGGTWRKALKSRRNSAAAGGQISVGIPVGMQTWLDLSSQSKALALRASGFPKKTHRPKTMFSQAKWPSKRKNFTFTSMPGRVGGLRRPVRLLHHYF